MKRKVKLFIAMSLDGFIAKLDGSVDWLQGEDESYEGFSSYEKFIKEIDTIIMGNKTYQQIINELSTENWPYQGLTSYVLTHQKQASKKEIHFINEPLIELLNSLLNKTGKDIWICGGASIVNQMIKLNLIDQYHITIVPIILGQGIPLFNNDNHTQKLRLIDSQNYNGLVECIYDVQALD